ncbi:hypothetical protein ACERIM_00005 [Natrinema sp. H-ect1]|uniref:hypothetical protein n=1 Tax=Natrinema sp. H-ect1 TaxID=3242700 RepID=UPI00359E73AD
MSDDENNIDISLNNLVAMGLTPARAYHYHRVVVKGQSPEQVAELRDCTPENVTRSLEYVHDYLQDLIEPLEDDDE